MALQESSNSQTISHSDTSQRLEFPLLLKQTISIIICVHSKVYYFVNGELSRAKIKLVSLSTLRRRLLRNIALQCSQNFYLDFTVIKWSYTNTFITKYKFSTLYNNDMYRTLFIRVLTYRMPVRYLLP